jgi:preprotein translocase SecF subunit
MMKIQIIKRRKTFYILSSLVIIAGLVMGMINGLNYGIDFTGGTLLQISLGQEVTVAEVREITDAFDTEAEVVHAGDVNQEVMIKTQTNLTPEQRTAVFKEFQAKYNLPDDAFIKSEKFGPSVGEEIRRNAYLSIAIATALMLLYITVRFEFRFGLAAVAALIHDVLIGLSVYAIFRLQVNSSFVAAILTIVGYSINDTIVLFDRVRENRKSMKRGEYEELIDSSISQTMTRTINTSITTLVAILCLYIFGVTAIREFALPLLVGVVVGTYSSIFIASPAWYEMMIRDKHHKRSYSGKNA